MAQVKNKRVAVKPLHDSNKKAADSQIIIICESAAQIFNQKKQFILPSLLPLHLPLKPEQYYWL